MRPREQKRKMRAVVAGNGGGFGEGGYEVHVADRGYRSYGDNPALCPGHTASLDVSVGVCPLLDKPLPCM